MKKMNTNLKNKLNDAKVGREPQTESIDACTSSIQLRKYRNELLKEWLKSANFSLQILL
jgi:hypothetical protein